MSVSLSRVLLLLALGVAACAPTAPTAPTGANNPGQPAAPKRAANQSLRVAQTGIPASLSPETSATNIPFFSALFDTLVTFEENYKVVPQVAEKWEYRNGSWIFQIRNDVVFTNGTPLTAEDVAFSLNLIADKKLPQTTYLGNLKSARAVDAKTVQVESVTPDATLLNGMPWGFILPKAYYEQVGTRDFGIKAIGSGPYEVVDFQASQAATFKKKATEHPFRKVIATELKFQSVPEQSSVVAGLRTGDIDLTSHVSFSVDNADLLKKDGLGVLILNASNVSVLMPQIENRNRNTPLTNKLVRQAVNYAINREDMAKNLYKGQAVSVSQLSFAGSEMFINDLKGYPYDPAMAKKLLAEAGYSNGFKLAVGIDFTPSSVNPLIPTAFQSYLRDVGIEAEVTSIEIGAFLDKFYGRNGQTRGDFMFWSSGDADGVSAQYRGRMHCDAPESSIWWCNQEFTRLFDLSRGEPDVKKRSEMVQQAHKVLLDDVAFAPMLVVPLHVVHGKNIQGAKYTTPIVYRFDNAYRSE